MTRSALARRLPRPLRRHVLHFEAAIEDAVAPSHAACPMAPACSTPAPAKASTPAGSPASATAAWISPSATPPGTTAAWTFWRISPRSRSRAAAFDAALHIVTIEHLPEPGCALAEIARVLKPGAPLLLAAPHEWETHQPPHDYFRSPVSACSTCLKWPASRMPSCVPAAATFRLLARRLLNGLQFFSGGARWLLFPLAALLLVPPALVLPCLDSLDRDRNFTLGYICTAKKRA